MLSHPLAVVVLAAGKGTRMRSALPKVLHPLAGRPLLAYVLDSVLPLNALHNLVIVGYGAAEVMARCADPRLQFVTQAPQLGTGHAVLQTEPLLRDFSGDVLVLCGDMPFIKRSTLEELLAAHRRSGAACTLLCLRSREPRDFGRILRDSSGAVTGIVENKDASPAQKTIDEYNAGVYCFQKDLLFAAIGQTGNRNAQGEYYLTDTIQHLAQRRLGIQSIQTGNEREILGINSADDLRQAEAVLAAPPQPGE